MPRTPVVGPRNKRQAEDQLQEALRRSIADAREAPNTSARRSSDVGRSAESGSRSRSRSRSVQASRTDDADDADEEEGEEEEEEVEEEEEEVEEEEEEEGEDEEGGEEEEEEAQGADYSNIRSLSGSTEDRVNPDAVDPAIVQSAGSRSHSRGRTSGTSGSRASSSSSSSSRRTASAVFSDRSRSSTPSVNGERSMSVSSGSTIRDGRDQPRFESIRRHAHSRYALDGEGHINEGIFLQNNERLNAAMDQVRVAYPRKAGRREIPAGQLADTELKRLHLTPSRRTYKFKKNFLEANVKKFDTIAQAEDARQRYPGSKVEEIKKGGKVVGYRLRTQQYLAAVAERRRLTQSQFVQVIPRNRLYDGTDPVVKKGFRTTLYPRPADAGQGVADGKLQSYVQMFKPDGGKYYATPMWLRRWMDKHPYISIAYIDQAVVNFDHKKNNVRLYRLEIEDEPPANKLNGIDTALINVIKKSDGPAYFHFRKTVADGEITSSYVPDRTGVETVADAEKAINAYKTVRERAYERAAKMEAQAKRTLRDTRLISTDATCGYLCFPGKVKPIYMLYWDENEDMAIQAITATRTWIKVHRQVEHENGTVTPLKITATSQQMYISLPRRVQSRESGNDSIADVVLLGDHDKLRQSAWRSTEFNATRCFATTLPIDAKRGASPIRTLNFDRPSVHATIRGCPRLNSGVETQMAQMDAIDSITRKLDPKTTSRELYSQLRFCSFWSGRIRALAKILDSMDASPEVGIRVENVPPTEKVEGSDLIMPFKPDEMREYALAMINLGNDVWGDRKRWRIQRDSFKEETDLGLKKLRKDRYYVQIN